MTAEYVGVPRSTGEFILRDVTVVDVADGSRSGGLDVRISGGTITEIGAVSQHAAGITVVDGGGAFVVPGYVDSHVHALNDPGRVAGAYALMLANGITGFRQMSGSPKPGAGQQADRGRAPPGRGPAGRPRSANRWTPPGPPDPPAPAARVATAKHHGTSTAKQSAAATDAQRGPRICRHTLTTAQPA